MIVYGLNMQGKKDEVPVEVAQWLLERNPSYLNTIEFQINADPVRPEHASQYEPIAQKYSRLFSHTAPMGGILAVTFPYRTEIWHVRIVGGTNEDGSLTDRTQSATVLPLSAKQRAEIAGWDQSAVQVDEKNTGFLRQADDPLKDHPASMVALPADLRWTSELSLTGQELGDLLTDPTIADQVGRAILSKDWATLRRLTDQKRQA